MASRILHFCSIQSPPDVSFAALVFRQIKNPNIFSWNTIIKKFAESEAHSPLEAFYLYLEMLRRGIIPDKHTYPFILMACRSPSSFVSGKLLHSHCIILGFSGDIFVCTALMRMYLRCGNSTSAWVLFNEMPSRDVVSWTALISTLVENGDSEEALLVFKSMRSHDSTIYLVVPTILSATTACANLGSLNQTCALHALVEKTGFAENSFIENSLINCYSKCGLVVSASKIFHLMKAKDVLSWTSIISGFATNGMAPEALRAFVGMISAGVSPDQVTFLAVLSACSHSGMIEEGKESFELMRNIYKLSPWQKHFGCMVDLFARAGQLNCAWDLVCEMPLKPSYAVFGALLSACRAGRELGIAELVTGEMLSSGERAGGTDAMLAGMYADECRWEEALMVRKVGREGRERRHSGQSWIEVEGVVYRFQVKDGTEPYLNEIVSALDGFVKDGWS